MLVRFRQLAAEKAVLEPDPMNPDRVTLLIGTIEWPMAVPIVRKSGRWSFDIQEGKAEIRRRTIGGNELDAIEICRGYVEAQQTYAETDWDGNGVLEYAKKIVSSEGKKDGLYWPGGDSPGRGRLREGGCAGIYGVDRRRARSRTTATSIRCSWPRDRMPPGRARLCGPRADDRGLRAGCVARGIWRLGDQNFIVNQDGIVYEKDLGPTTAAVATAMTRFNPDKSWQVSPDETEQ